MKVYEQREVIIPDQLGGYYKQFFRPFKQIYAAKKAGQGLVGLQSYLQDPDFDLGAISVFRCLALYSFSLLKDHPDYSPFLIEGTAEGIEEDIVTMGKEAEGLIFQAMANALNAKIVHITLSSREAWIDYFTPLTPGQKVVLHVLLRPGRYNLLYPIAVQLQDQYMSATNSFRSPPLPVETNLKDYIETI